MLTQEELKELFHYDLETGIFRWKVKTHNRIKVNSIAGCKDKCGYIVIGINSVRYYAHRLAWLYIYGVLPQNEIDHINNIRDQNWIINLREATSGQNQQNLKKAQSNNKSSGLLGAYFNKCANKFVSKITINKKTIYLGSYDTAIKAHEVYVEAKRKLHEFNTL